jgi:hypothetical protein
VSSVLLMQKFSAIVRIMQIGGYNLKARNSVKPSANSAQEMLPWEAVRKLLLPNKNIYQAITFYVYFITKVS